jgi:hypothetical protein
VLAPAVAAAAASIPAALSIVASAAMPVFGRIGPSSRSGIRGIESALAVRHPSTR